MQKCGTTGLMHYLQGNPYLKAVPGEAHYFDSAINYAKGLVRDSNYSASSICGFFIPHKDVHNTGFIHKSGVHKSENSL